jgi:hypothetical protein
MSKSKSGKSKTSGSPRAQARKREEKARRARKRKRLRIASAAGVGALLLIAGVAAVFAYNRNEERVRDLSDVGTGVPAVVQVHDATCPVCTELRGNVADIEGEFDDDELLIRVADVHSDEGLAFAARYTTARRATLLFIDGNGELVDVHTGAQDIPTLRQSFSRHARGEL